MSEYNEWIWIAMAVLWVVVRVIPRLFRFAARRRTARAAESEKAVLRDQSGSRTGPPIEPS